MPVRWPALVGRCLEHSSAAWAAVVDVLNNREANPALVDRAIEVASDRKFVLEHGVKWKDLPEERLRRLLNHNEDHVAQAAALGLWDRLKNRTIPESLVNAWRRAIIRTVREEFWLKKLFEFDPLLAEAWLTHWIDAGSAHRNIASGLRLQWSLWRGQENSRVRRLGLSSASEHWETQEFPPYSA